MLDPAPCVQTCLVHNTPTCTCHPALNTCCSCKQHAMALQPLQAPFHGSSLKCCRNIDLAMNRDPGCHRCACECRQSPGQHELCMCSMGERGHLLHDLRGAEVALQAHAAGEAELAVLRAANLRGDAERGAGPAGARPGHRYDHRLHRPGCAFALQRALKELQSLVAVPSAWVGGESRPTGLLFWAVSRAGLRREPLRPAAAAHQASSWRRCCRGSVCCRCGVMQGDWGAAGWSRAPDIRYSTIFICQARTCSSRDNAAKVSSVVYDSWMTRRRFSKSRSSKGCRLGRAGEHVLHLQLEQQLACAVSSCLRALQLQLPIHGHTLAQSFPAVWLQCHACLPD